MKICQKCQASFPNHVKIEGKRRNLKNRKYCLTCSPFGRHNTKTLDKSNIPKKYKCKCGETDPKKFYGNKSKICGKCHNKYTLKAGQDRRQRTINKLGGKCKICGYDKYYGAIDIHHIDPTKKDVNFASLRGWSWERIEKEKEIENCVALCKVCHVEVHAGITKIGD